MAPLDTKRLTLQWAVLRDSSGHYRAKHVMDLVASEWSQAVDRSEKYLSACEIANQLNTVENVHEA